jgi:hypothetical protein
VHAYIRFMRGHPPRHLPERAAACLTCACEDPRNATARILLRHTCSLSVTGVLAAILIADSSEHVDIVNLARTAIEEQREICREHGPFKSRRCGEHGRVALQKK